MRNAFSKGSRPGKSLVSAAWAGALAAYVLEKSSKYIEYSCGFSPGALASALRRRTEIRSTYAFASPKVVVIALAVGCAACNAPTESSEFPTRDFKQFEAEVYPVLIRDCGFHACHGAPERFFRVWGPGRQRMDPLSRAFATRTGQESATNVLLALSMIDAKNPSRSLLLRKPLAVEAGGAGHLGIDKYGRNVYRTVNDEGYVAIARWVMATPTPITAPPVVPPTNPPAP